MKQEREALVVLGMHRSGTSALTRVLSLCGASLPKTLPSSREDNQLGFWEPAKVQQLHDKLLQDLGSSWDSIHMLSNEWFELEENQTYTDSMVDVVEEEFLDSNLFVLKDPRVCKLLPWWTKIFERLNVVAKYIIVVRHPLEVAESLAVRDKFAYEKSFLLWLQHTILAEKNTRSCQRTFVSYEYLLNDWESLMQDICLDLNIKSPFFIFKNKSLIDEFLQPNLRHHKVESGEKNGLILPRIVEEVFTQFKLLVEGETIQIQKLDKIYNLLSESHFSLKSLIVFQSGERTSSHVLATQLHKSQAQLQAQLRESQAQLRESQAQLHESQTQLQAQLHESQTQLQAQLHENQTQLQAQLRENQAQLQAVHNEVSKLLDESLNIKAILNQKPKSLSQQIKQLWGYLGFMKKNN
ncbi:MAG: hypothetical protein F6K31_21235 [Symploca sp. SIO2G7]|nr:hypothetical protein [Symploca sp. SIO2G7]